MVWARVQSKSGTGATTTVTVTMTSTPVVGNKIIAIGTWGSGSIALTTMRDGNANDLTVAATSIHGTTNTQKVFYYDVPATPSSTFTITIASTADTSLLVLEVSGLAAGNTNAAAIDGTPGTINGIATPTGSPTYTSTALNEFLLTTFTDEGVGATVTQPAGYTLDANSVNTSSIENDLAAFKNSANGAEASSWSYTGTSQWDVITLAFKLAAAAVARPSQHLVTQQARTRASIW